MIDWLERARREIRKSVDQTTLNTVVRPLSSVLRVPQSTTGASNDSNEGGLNGESAVVDGAALAGTDAPSYPRDETDKSRGVSNDGNDGASDRVHLVPEVPVVAVPARPRQYTLAESEWIDERAAIMEFDAGMDRPQADARARTQFMLRDLLVASRRCGNCTNAQTFFTSADRLGFNHVHTTCRKPVEAGLVQRYVIVYPPDEYAQNCPAWDKRIEQ